MPGQNWYTPIACWLGYGSEVPMKGITEELAEVQLNLKGTSWTNNEELDQNGGSFLKECGGWLPACKTPKRESDDVVDIKNG